MCDFPYDLDDRVEDEKTTPNALAGQVVIGVVGESGRYAGTAKMAARLTGLVWDAMDGWSLIVFKAPCQVMS